MKIRFDQMLKTRSNAVNAALVIGLLSLFFLGCTCGKSFDLGNLNANSSSNSLTGTKSSNREVTLGKDDKNDTKSDDSSTDSDDAVTADASTGQVPSDEALQAMTRKTVLDFNKAIQDADFTDFYSNIAAPWKKQTSAEKMLQSFKPFIDANVDFNEVKSLTATFDEDPKVERKLGYKTLQLVGRYDTSPLVTKFKLDYIPEGKEWKLSSIYINTKAD